MNEVRETSREVGSERLPGGGTRATILKAVLAGGYFVTLLCCGFLALMLRTGRVRWSAFGLAYTGVVFLLGLTGALARGAARAPPRNPGAWHAGFIYVDRGDPALFVPTLRKRGYTLNLGNPFAVLLTFALLAVPLAALLGLSAP